MLFFEILILTESKNRLRQWTKDNFLNRLSDFMWNQNERVGILPVIHGTSVSIAWKVCVGGFKTHFFIISYDPFFILFQHRFPDLLFRIRQFIST